MWSEAYAEIRTKIAKSEIENGRKFVSFLLNMKTEKIKIASMEKRLVLLRIFYDDILSKTNPAIAYKWLKSLEDEGIEIPAELMEQAACFNEYHGGRE